MATLGELVTDAAAAIIVRVNEVWMVCRLGAKTAAATRHHSAANHDGLVIFIMLDAGYRN